MGDPEWRVDSPHARHSAPGAALGYPELPSPVSPTMPCTPQAGVRADDDFGEPRRQHHGLGLPAGPVHQLPALGLSGGARPLPSLRRATLGLLRAAAPSPKPTACARPVSRAMTPEERVARLHSVSGLAARAVARRCLSGQIHALDADALSRPPLPPPMPALPATQVKPTFADVARGSQDQ
ncbi:hypothetical protein LPJ61_004099 [Coemansia biformis]|uniref:Uncharacterized protein n=1 Tax=Coemansia biformis TaxID=1286918 RepID=A0A9W7Y9B5_9FUNG|nr:hypothetical protein LPJ61_004099 [Coemansia biformis]